MLHVFNTNIDQIIKTYEQRITAGEAATYKTGPIVTVRRMIESKRTDRAIGG